MVCKPHLRNLKRETYVATQKQISAMSTPHLVTEFRAINNRLVVAKLTGGKSSTVIEPIAVALRRELLARNVAIQPTNYAVDEND